MSAARFSLRLPRACGGVSGMTATTARHLGSSPRMRGCFPIAGSPDEATHVFPAHAGVFLTAFIPKALACCLPRACGGVSQLNPRTATGVWLDALGLPRACGGVSREKAKGKVGRVSSPRMRGCFSTASGMKSRQSVFPAHAGVFPLLISEIRLHSRLPRACGGVSDKMNFAAPKSASSPRMRGCF